VALALALPVVARAELVAPGVVSAALAAAADGSPRVAYVQGAELMVASRTDGVWTRDQAAALPAPGGVVAGIAVAPSGRLAVLAEAANGRWLVLYERIGPTTRLTSLLPRLTAGARIGRAGLALDRRGLPVVAYAEWRPSQRTFLRLLRFQRGRYRSAPVTLRGFPPSDLPPAAAPVVLRSGAVRVVEAYGSGSSAAIDWMPQRSDWLGQFLYSSPIATLAGPVSAAAAPTGGVDAAWTVGFPRLGTVAVVLAHHGTPVQTSVVLDDAVLAGLAVGTGGPALAATELVADGGGVLTAAVLREPAGSTLELDGAAAGIAASPDGSTQLLLARAGSLEWYPAPAAPEPAVKLAASPIAGGVALSGSVAGATEGAVTIYRERAGAERVAIASAPLAPDGSFAAVDDAADGAAFYRAVFVEPVTGLPVASLLRSAVAPG
jgi:hypothetical protein